MEGQGGSSKDGDNRIDTRWWDTRFSIQTYRTRQETRRNPLNASRRPPKEAHAPFLADGEVVILEISHVS